VVKVLSFYTKDICPICKNRAKEVSSITINSLVKKEVGLKEWTNPKTVCYCFNWTKEKIENEIKEFLETKAIEDITEKMNTTGCDCEHNNPSGNCCLKDVKKVIKELR
jgi:fatty acid-binding protein DegV